MIAQRRRLSSLPVIACLLVMAGAWIGAAGPKPAAIPLSITVTGEVPAATESGTSCEQIGLEGPSALRVRNDSYGSAPFPYANGVDQVSATLDDSNGWIGFSTNPNPYPRQPGPRRLMLALCGGVYYEANPAAFEGVVAADVMTLLFKTSPDQADFPSLRAMPLGTSTIRRFRIDWPRQNPVYRLDWHNDASSDAVLVTCSEVTTSGSGTACSAWTVTQYTDGRAAVMVRTKRGYAPLGSVIMPFEMVVKVQ